MKKITYLLSLILLVGFTANAQTYTEDFESLAKKGYKSETVTLNGVDWNFTGSSTGNGKSDWKIGNISARLAGTNKATSNSEVSKIEMLSNKAGGIGNITFQYRQYGHDSQIPWKVEWSADGSTWTTIQEITATEEVQTFSYDLNQASARIRIIANGFETSSKNGKRINIDNLVLTDNGGAGEPILSTAPSTLDFGAVLVGTTSTELEVNVSAGNFTAAPTYSIMGANASDFNATGTLTTDGGTIKIKFTPSAATMRTATLEVKGEGKTATVTLNGTGTNSSNPYNLDDSAPTTSLFEEFNSESTALPNGWVSYSVKGDREWQVKSYKDSKYAQMSAYTGTGAYQTLLISPAINFDGLSKKDLKFEWKSGYTKEGTLLKVYAMSKDGNTKVELKTINDNSNSSGYNTATEETIDLSAISGVQFIVFEYNGNADKGETTTYQVDNVKIPSDATGLATPTYNELSVWTKDNHVMFNADANELVEVYNIAGQKLMNKLSSEGLNQIYIPTQGVVIVKVGNRIGKVIL